MSNQPDAKPSRFLFISYYFPPIKSVAVMRAYYLQRELQRQGSVIHVLTTSNRSRLPQENLPFQVKELHAIPTFDYRTLASFARRNQTHFPEEQKKGWRQVLIKIVNSFPFNLIFGEGGAIYILHAFIRGRKKIQTDGITHIYSSFRPYADHFTAYLLKQSYPNLCWIADFRDLHVDPVLKNVWFPSLQHWCNRKILSQASLIVTVSEGLADHLRQYKRDVYVLKNGIHLESSQRIPPLHFSKFTIAYTGSLFQNKRDPSLLLQVLSELVAEGKMQREALSLIYAGKDGKAWLKWLEKFGLTDIFTDCGLLPLKESLRIQHSAHVNLLLTYAEKQLTGNLTGKVFEYLAAGKPVLAIIKGSRDREMEELLDKTGTGMVAYPDYDENEQVRTFLLKNYLEWKVTGTAGHLFHPKAMEHQSWHSVIKQFLEAKVFPTVGQNAAV